MIFKKAPILKGKTCKSCTNIINVIKNQKSLAKSKKVWYNNQRNRVKVREWARKSTLSFMKKYFYR